MSTWEIWKLRLAALSEVPPWEAMITRFLAALGGAWLILETLSWAYPSLFSASDRPIILGCAALVGVSIALAKALPPVKCMKAFPGKGAKIELVVGDILCPNETCNIGILSSDYFDSCVSTAISIRSVKGQFVQRFFQGNVGPFDAAVDASLDAQGIVGAHNPEKKRGANRTQRYPIGTAATVPLSGRNAFLIVGPTIDVETTKTTTDAHGLWTSLLALWNAAATHGARDAIAIPIWGANLGNAPGNRLVLFQTILCSFAAAWASGHQPPTRHLKVVIWHGDYDPREFNEMASWLKSFGP